MRIKTILFYALCVLFSAGCAKETHPELKENENISNLVVKGTLTSGPTTEYPSVVDEKAGTITVQVPYYLSDTEEIQGDLTKMKLSATLPQGARFSPAITGVHDLVSGFKSTLRLANGDKIAFTFHAAYVKSDLSALTGMKFSDPNMKSPIAVKQPDAENAKGQITVVRSPSTEEALKAVVPVISPWASVTSDNYDKSKGTIDLTLGKDVVVTSHSGKTSTAYAVAFEVPKTVEYGVGHIEAMFGIQPTTDDPKGFEAGANRTMAVIGNYLILSNSKDFTKMPVYNRFSGELLPDVTVNTTGLVAGREIHAITSDDAGHLVAVAYSSTLDGAPDSYATVRGWVWADGIDKAPKSIIWADLKGGAFANAPYKVNNVTKLDIFRTVTVKGDITKGDALMATCSKNVPRPVFIRFKDGTMQIPAYVEWPAGAGIQVSMWNGTKVKVLNTDTAALKYFWSSANFRTNIVYSDTRNGFGFDLPSSHFWRGSGTYDHNSMSLDYIEFNGAHYLAVSNGLYAGHQRDKVNQMYYRCYVADLGVTPSKSSLVDGFLFDTREGNAEGTANIPGTGYALTGMTSPSSFVSGKTVLGPDAEDTGDVVFANGTDGYSVQLYILTTDQGLIGYNLTKLAM